MAIEESVDIIFAEVQGHHRRWMMSPLDRFCQSQLGQVTWFFDQRLDASALKNSLAQVLAYYPQLSGRFNRAGWVDMNNAGVPFSVRRCHHIRLEQATLSKNSCADFGDFRPQARVNKGLEPIVTVTLTELNDGCVLSICSSHGCLDGSSFHNFALNWSRLHCGEAIDTPVFDQSCLPDYNRHDKDSVANRIKDNHWVSVSPLSFVKMLWNKATNKKAAALEPIWLSADELKSIKSHVEQTIQCPYISTNDAVSAYLGQHCSKLFDLQPGERFTLVSAVDCRGRMETLPTTFVGNGIAINKLVEFSSSDSVGAIASDIHRNLSKSLDKKSGYLQEHLLLLLQVMKYKLLAMPFDFTLEHRRPPRLLSINNFSKFPMYQINFGSQQQPLQPTLIVPHEPTDQVLLWPAPAGQGGAYVYFTGSVASSLQKRPLTDAWWQQLRRFNQTKPQPVTESDNVEMFETAQ